MFKKHFSFKDPSDMLEKLTKAKSKKDKQIVNLIKTGLKDLNKEIEKMSENEKKKN